MTTTNPTRYVIFAGDVYYPAGGMLDLYAKASTLEEATEIAKEAVEIGSRPHGCLWRKQPLEVNNEEPEKETNHTTYPCDWAQIVDLISMKIIAYVRGEDDTVSREEAKAREDELQDLSYPPLIEDTDYYEEIPKKVAKFDWC
jgi:hypothetical protein